MAKATIELSESLLKTIKLCNKKAYEALTAFQAGADQAEVQHILSTADVYTSGEHYVNCQKRKIAPHYVNQSKDFVAALVAGDIDAAKKRILGVCESIQDCHGYRDLEWLVGSNVLGPDLAAKKLFPYFE